MEVEELRGKMAIWDMDKQKWEAENAELQRSLLLWTQQKEELEQQGERGRRELQTRWASALCHPQTWHPHPLRGPLP